MPLHWPPLPPWTEVVDAAERLILPAGGLAFVVPLASRWVFGPKSLPIATPFGVAAGLGLAYGLRGSAPWQPEDFGTGWMHVAWAAALAAGGLAAVLSVRWSWLAKLAAAAAAAWMLLPGDLRERPTWFAALASAMALPWLAAPTDAAVPRRQLPERSLWLALALAALAVVALHAPYLRVTDFAMMAACALMGAAAASALLGRNGREVEGVGCLSLPALSLCVWNDTASAIPAVGFACVGLAAVPMAAFPWLPQTGWKSVVIRGTCVLVPAAIAVLTAMTYEEASYG